jgi:hypothetical protein
LDGERLTRQELSWLLTQEARSAADRLRHDVAVLGAPKAPDDPAVAVGPALDALEDAMQALASLHKGTGARGRRGRIDVAALLWEIAPEARVAFDTGSGTEVYGDETELRRMLQVLVSAAHPAGVERSIPELTIRRDGADVRVAVTLGPDASPPSGSERAWLARMAMRYGGRLELEGGNLAVLLRAEGASAREIEELRRELAAAQQQGEAYARELAAVFAVHGSDLPPPPAAAAAPSSSSQLATMAAFAGALVAALRPVLASIGKEIAPARGRGGDAGALAEQVAAALAPGSDLVAELARLAECPPDELPHGADLADLVRHAANDLAGRAARAGANIELHLEEAETRVAATAATLLARVLLAHAISATPRGGTVSVELRAAGGRAELTIDDGGPSVPTSVRPALLAQRTDPATFGRPPGYAMLEAAALAAHLHADLAVDESPDGGTRVRVRFPPR